MIVSVINEPVAETGCFRTGSCSFSTYGRGLKSGKTAFCNSLKFQPHLRLSQNFSFGKATLILFN
jgi:hypothetical protein